MLSTPTSAWPLYLFVNGEPNEVLGSGSLPQVEALEVALQPLI